MGSLAHAHPFLDGNGRTIMVVHTELAKRAGISIEWEKTNKVDYLTALTRELDQPGKGHLDAYLKPYVQKATDRENQIQTLQSLPGLGPQAEAPKPMASPASDKETPKPSHEGEKSRGQPMC
jgi:cell filamentation protein